MRNVLRLTAIAAILGWASLAQAGDIPCDGTTAAKVTGTIACAFGHVNNDSEAQVNDDEMFTYSDWEFAQKDNDADGTDETDIDVGFSLTGDVLMGTWSIDDIWAMYTDVMIVFKGGGGNISPDVYVGYLLEMGAVMGDYMTPFVNANNQNPAEISHVSIYVRGPRDMSVPEPGTLTLLGLGLAGIGFARRRRRA